MKHFEHLIFILYYNYQIEHDKFKNMMQISTIFHVSGGKKKRVIVNLVKKKKYVPS